MKLLLFSFAAIFLLQSVACQDVAPTKKCEQFLPDDTCTTLRNIAQKFHEKVGIVNQAITDAFNHHKTRAAEMLAYVKEYIVARANNFKCEDVISAESCTKISDIAKKLHLTATQASLAVKEAIVNGATQVKDVYNKAVAYMRDRLSTLTCENVLGDDKCKQLKDFATAAHIKLSEVNTAVKEAIVEGASTAKEKIDRALALLKTEVTCDKVLGEKACNALRTAAGELKENVGIVHQAVVEALSKHLTKASEILTSVKDTLVEKAQNFKCTDVLSEAQCTKIGDIATHLKLKSDQISKAIKEAVVNSAAQAKEIYNRALGFLLNDVKNLQCKDLIPEATCTQIADYAKKIHAKSTDVAIAVKEAIIQGATTTKDYISKAKEYLKAKISCDKVLSEDACNKIRDLADKFHISLTKVDAFLREAISNGVTSVKELYQAAMEWIVEKWTGVFGDEKEVFKRGIGEITDSLRAKLREAAEKVLNALHVGSQKVRQTVMKLVAEGKIRISQIKEKVKELIATLGDKDGADDAIAIYRRSIKDTLVETLKTAHGKAKAWIEDLVKKSSEELEKMKGWIKEKLEKYGITSRADELESDFELVEHMLTKSMEAMVSDINDESTLQMSEAVVEKEEESDESFNDKVIRYFEKYVVDKVFTKKHRQAIDKWINDNKKYIRWVMGFSEKLGESYIAKLLGDFFAASSIFG